MRIITGAHVTRVLFNSEKREDKLVASGAEYAKDGRTYTVSARKEIIICGGTLNKAIRLSVKTLISLKKVPSKHPRYWSCLASAIRASLRRMVLLAFTICLALVKTSVCTRSISCHPRLTPWITEDHYWVPYIKEMDNKIDSFEILADPARAGQEWML